MFQRQTREPFPARNILLLAAIVLAFLFFILSQRRKTEPTPTPAPTEQPK